jgi:hypothetical protein
MRVIELYKNLHPEETVFTISGNSIIAFFHDAGFSFEERYFLNDIDDVYYKRRPRRRLTIPLFQRMAREIGCCLEGDSCPVPDYNYIPKIFSEYRFFMYSRRQRKISERKSVELSLKVLGWRRKVGA